ncbi:MAG TPA: MFS transporter, partial [Erwinia persicina]|nr:MFS transporter [Erwinia persicina]
GIVKGSIRDVLANGRLVKLNIGLLCLHILLMSSFVALPGQFEQAGLPAAEHWKVYLFTMLIAFASVLPFIIYAEVKRRMKRVFVGCVALMLVAEVVLWGAGNHFWTLVVGVQLFFIGFNLMEAILPSLVSKESPPGYRGTAMGLYSTSQFIGVAIGGSMGGWIYGHVDAQTVFLIGALIAAAWLMVSLTMQEPPYVSSLRITLEQNNEDKEQLEQRLKAQPGVAAVFIVPEERSAYVKIDSKITSRADIEKLIAAGV